MSLTYTALDRKIWTTELDEFVPDHIFDMHTHLWENKFKTKDTICHNDWLDHETCMSVLYDLSAMLYPRRNVALMSFALPVINAEYDKLNEWVSSQTKSFSNSHAALLITPEMPPCDIVSMIHAFGFKALKPYHHFAKNNQGGIRSYFTEEQMSIADELKLPVILHCRKNIAEDLDELIACLKRYPNIQWVLAHCDCAFSLQRFENILCQLRMFPNLWFDNSLIHDVYIHATLLKYFDRTRILFGSDNAYMIGGCRRGKIISYTDSILWAKDLPNTTFWIYEQLRALRQACDLIGITKTETEDIFYNNATRLFGL